MALPLHVLHRENVSNFAPTLGILAAWKLGTVFRDMGVHLSGLQMPLTFATTSGRPWLVDIFAVPMWARLAAVVPAIMSTILLFMDQVGESLQSEDHARDRS
eukprot:scaffold848_cov247-Pinguiococcus_pyrenoidosus.AAC.23